MRKCKLQKAISFMLSLIMVLGICIVTVPETAKAAGDVRCTVSADKQKLKRGDTVMVTVSMSGNTEAYGLKYELGYDTSRLKPGKPVPGEACKNLIYDPENGICFLWYSLRHFRQ